MAHELLREHLERQQIERRRGRIRIGVTFGVAGRIFADATEWAKNTERPVASWRGGGLEGALATVGKTMERSQVLREMAISRLLPATPFDATALWESLGSKEQRQRVEQTFPAGPMRDAIERLAAVSPEVSDNFWSAERFKASLELGEGIAEPLLFGWIEPFEVEGFEWCDAFAEIAPRVPVLSTPE